DLALCNTELNPFTNMSCPTFGGQYNADIFFFSRFVPTVIVAKLNHYLRKRMGSIFETKTTNKLGNIGY
ncbi:hypothetical protein, partial [Streptococcus equi]|uniref:hypothetical protein n=1 Tax=Streptococcus equi TaxID=1336 RepID=UPI000A72E2C5